MVIKIKEKFKNSFYLNHNYHYHLTYMGLGSSCKKILDFGCGNGRFIGKIQAENRELHGMDVDKNLLAVAVKEYPHITFKNLEIGAKLPYLDGYFDAVVMNHVLEHVDSEERTIKECSRVLKRNGSLFLSSPYAGLFEWADMANLRYRSPRVHKYLYKKIWGEEEYNRKFAEDNEMYGDCSTPRKWHKHYSETEIRNILKDYFVIDEFVKYSFFLPFLFFLYNIFDIVFKQKDSLFVRKLIWLDSKLRFGDYSYNFFVSAKKK